MTEREKVARCMTGSSETRATNWLRGGAIMLSESCPVCYSPLFKLAKEVWCPTCNKQVVMVKGEEEVSKLAAPLLLSSVEETILFKLQEVVTRLKEETNIEKLQQTAQSLSTLLEVYKKATELRRQKE